MGLYETQPQLPFPAEADPNQPELPFVNREDILKKGDFLWETLQTIEQNLANDAGLTTEGRGELESSRQYYEAQLGHVLELGTELGFFHREGEGAPNDNIETVAA